jgi:diadenosine tetraphosphate (Ap4A) HIT family hydrolase
MSDFSLDPRLAADTHLVADWPLSRVLLMDDARYPWAILVPRKAGVSEWFDLSTDDQARLSREAMALAAHMKQAFGARKMNVAALGNMVAQLHVHVVARFESDAAWPGPVWGVGTKTLYGPQARDQVLATLKRLAPP